MLGIIISAAAIAALWVALWRADDLEDARRAGWVRRGQGRDR